MLRFIQIPSFVRFVEMLKRVGWLQMRDVLQTEELDVPAGVTVEIKSRIITVTGPRGTLKKNVRHTGHPARQEQDVRQGTLSLPKALTKRVRALTDGEFSAVSRIPHGTAAESGMSYQHRWS